MKKIEVIKEDMINVLNSIKELIEEKRKEDINLDRVVEDSLLKEIEKYLILSIGWFDFTDLHIEEEEEVFEVAYTLTKGTIFEDSILLVKKQERINLIIKVLKSITERVHSFYNRYEQYNEQILINLINSLILLKEI